MEREKRKRTVRRYCAAFGCLNNTSNTPNLSLFKLPTDPVRSREWLAIMGREDLLNKKELNAQSYQICCEHFDESAIKRMAVIKLKPDATPIPYSSTKPDNIPSTSEETIPDIDSKSDIKLLPLSISTYNVATQTMPITSPPSSHERSTQTTKKLAEDTPFNRKLTKQLTESESKCRKLEKEFNKIKKELELKNTPISLDTEDDINRRFQKLINWQNKLKNKSKGNRYAAEYKLFALNLHYSSPYTYRCLQTILKLPAPSTLNRFQLKIPPKLDNRVLETLTSKVKSLPEQAKFCCICVGNMNVKRNLNYNVKTDEVIGFVNIDGHISPEIASNAYVIMVQGLYVNWKQPIAYAFLANTTHYEELDLWFINIIRNLFSLGIEIKAFISDQGSNFDKYAKEIKKVTIENPFFSIDEHKIYYMFDVPHLIKCVRNHMLTNNFYYNGKVISWEYIQTLYKDQKDKKCRLIPKVTKSHIQPNNIKKMRVKYAAQIFSRTVYAALETYIDFGKISDDAIATASFIKLMDDLFDILNSSILKSVKKLRSAFRMSIDQKKVLNEAKNMFANIKCIDRSGKDVTNEIETFHNFQISIQAIEQLFEDLKKEGLQYLFTRRLNKDSLENFFVSVRQQRYKDGNDTVPTPTQFTDIFSKLFLRNMLKNSQSANGETDILDILLKAEDVVNTNIIIPEADSRPSQVLLEDEKEHRINLPEVNSLVYVASYLIYICSEKHECNEMQEKYKSFPELDQNQLFSRFKAYNKNAPFYGSLKLPPQELIEYVEMLENTFVHNFEKCVQRKPGNTCFELLMQIPPVTLCSCYPTYYFVKLFVRLRIFDILKFNNRRFKVGQNANNHCLKVNQLYR